MRTPLYFCCPLAVICLTLAGCGGDTPEPSSSSASAEVDPCTLLTAAEIEATTGVTPGKTERPDPRVNSCEWSNPDPDSVAPVAVIALSWHSSVSWDEYREYMIEGDYGDPAANGERVDIGRWGHYQPEVSAIQVQTDSKTLITLSVRGATREQIVDLASKAVARVH